MTQELPEEFWQGVEQFNQGQFYACHDTLEALWMEAREPLKNFYQGILQIAVALYHLNNSNWRGAVILLGEGISRLQRYPPVYEGIDIDELLNQSATLLAALQTAGPDKINDWVISNGVIAGLTIGEQSVALTQTPTAYTEKGHNAVSLPKIIYVES